MKDYKYTSKNLSKLKNKINKTFHHIHKQLEKPSKKQFGVRSEFFTQRFGLPLAAFIIIFVLFFSVKALLFSNPIKNISLPQASFIGERFVKAEFHSLENPHATGGPDVGKFNQNDPELNFFFYKVKPGESVYSISKKLHLNMDTIISLNSMDNAHTIGVNERILVPNRRGILYTVKAKDNLDKISKKYGIKVKDILEVNNKNSEDIHPGDVLFLPDAKLSARERAKALGYMFSKPLHGRFTSPFGMRFHPILHRMRFHTGIDIAAPIGTRVKAAKDGRVVFAGWNGGYGKMIIIRHQFGYSTVYGHLSRISVRRGQYVRAGQVIGRVGSTGMSTGPHLHFEVRKYGRPTNPLRYAGLHKHGRYY